MSKVSEILNIRESTYGDATENFRAIGVIWGQLLSLDYSLDPQTVALLMIALKTYRATRNFEHKDSLLDIIGYTELALKIE
jgi:hypothetical protein